ncbi:hypothetical protein EBR96_10020 [bacterium]|nr:hypothetical protein [bacterium]
MEAAAIRGYLSGLRDPNTRYLDADTYRALTVRVKGDNVSGLSRAERIGSLGYIRISSFESLKVSDEVKATVERLQKDGIKGLIIDLRDNGGGLYSSAVKIADLLMENVPVVSMVDRYGEKTTEVAGETAPFARLRIVVLVNEGSASASEIFAGAVKDHHRGILVGVDTYGKASMQKVLPLSDGSAVLYTFARYLTPSGRDISKKGIAVDVSVPRADRDSATGNSLPLFHDPQVMAAVRVLENNL